MKIVAISDTHNGHDKIVIPPCDILIHGGDATFRGRKEEVESFAKWFDKQPAKHKVFIPGNHELGVEAQWPGSKAWYLDHCPSAHLLMNSDVTLDGVKIWGSPVTPWFHDWAWNVARGPAIKKYWDMIPADTSIVVTHGPPYGILDAVNRGFGRADWNPQEHVGCQDLMDAMLRIKPKLHIFGHIHEGYGTQVFQDTIYCNASIMDEHYDPVNLPFEFDL